MPGSFHKASSPLERVGWSPLLGASRLAEVGSRIKGGLLSRDGLHRKPLGLFLTLGSVYESSAQLPSSPIASPGSVAAWKALCLRGLASRLCLLGVASHRRLRMWE